MIRLKPLPPIALTNLQPAFYDVESATAIEMVSKLYAYIQNMVNDYNAFITEVNNELENFENDINCNINEFECCIKKLISDYIESVDIKIDLQNKEIKDAIDYMKDNLDSSLNELLNELVESGTLYTSMVYNSETEELDIVISEGGNNNG